MNFYKVDWRKFINDLLLIELRKPMITAYLNALLKPVKKQHADFLTYRKNALYRVQHNSQIASIEAVLNDEFDAVLRRIRIRNVEFKEQVWFYEPEENKEVWFYEPADNKPVYFYEEDELIGSGVDFVVCVPPILQPGTITDENALLTKMRGLIDYFKLYSKNYQILWVQIEN